MSIFGSMLSKLGIGSAHAAATAPTADAPAAPAGNATAAPAAGTPAPAGEPVDVEAVLEGMPSSDNLNWRESIVDLMKLLGLDSSLGSRKELADELGFDGDTNDSASMNIWLHKQVMTKLAENGGKVPDSLKA